MSKSHAMTIRGDMGKTMDKGEAWDLTIEKLAFGGQGIARKEGFVVFVKGAIPGDRVLVRPLRNRRAFAEAELLEILAPSPDRISPPCPYAGLCGGCQWQHLTYARQLAAKRLFVAEALDHLAGLPHAPVLETIPSPDLFAYRNKMEFSFCDREWLPRETYALQGNRPAFALGLHVPGVYSRVLDVEACLLQAELGNAILGWVKAFARESGRRPYALKTWQGLWRFLVLRRSIARDEWMVSIVTSGEDDEAVRPIADLLLARTDRIRTVVHTINRKKASIATGEKEIRLHGDGVIEDTLGSSVFRISAGSFFQTNTRGAERLYSRIADMAELTGKETVLDLYSGTGTIPLFLSPRAGRITGIEINEQAVLDARINCERNGIDNCRFVCGDIRRTLAGVAERPDIVVLDPPRAGLHPDVLNTLLHLEAGVLIYVSCNPATLAKDLKGLLSAYDLVEVQPVDMFPHTYHVESIAKLTKSLKKGVNA